MNHSFVSLLADDNWSNQYTDTGWFSIAFTLIFVAFVMGNIYRAHASHRGGKSSFIRKIPGMNAIDEAVGRATEMGKPVIMVPGLQDLRASTMQALNIFVYVSRVAAKFANPILLCVGDPTVYTVAQEMIRDAYESEGFGDRYDQNSVRFITDRQFAFAAGVAGLVLREQTAAAFFMGDFFAESLIFAETANSIGAIQIASSTQTTQTPFFIAACDYVLIGDEFYAASAYLTRQPVLVGSLTGQDWAKLLLMGTIFLGTLATTFQKGIFHPNQISAERQHMQFVPIPSRDVKYGDTFFGHLFQPQDDPSLANTIHREKEPPTPSAAGSAGGGN